MSTTDNKTTETEGPTLYEQASEAAQGAGEAISSALGYEKESDAHKAGREAVEYVTETVAAAGNYVSETATSVKDAVTEATTSASQTANDTAESASMTASDVCDGIADGAGKA